MSQIYQRIKEAGRKLGYNTDAEIERACGIPRTLSNIKKTDCIPRDETLIKLCDGLGVTEEYIIGDERRRRAQGIQRGQEQEPSQNPDRLREFVRLLSSLDDKDFETMIDYMHYLNSRKGQR